MFIEETSLVIVALHHTSLHVFVNFVCLITCLDFVILCANGKPCWPQSNDKSNLLPKWQFKVSHMAVLRGRSYILSLMYSLYELVSMHAQSFCCIVLVWHVSLFILKVNLDSVMS